MLPQFGMSEFLLLAVAALIIVGPKDLPLMMRKLGQMVAKGREAAKEFQAAFDDIARQAELQELRKEIEDLKQANAVTEAQADLARFERDVNKDVMQRDAGTPASTKPATDTNTPGAKPDTPPKPATTKPADPPSPKPSSLDDGTLKGDPA